MKTFLRVSAIIFLFLFFVEAVCFGWWGKKPAEKIPDLWPDKLDKRKLFIYDNTFIYAAKNSEADKINKLVRQVNKELGSGDSENIRPGLLIVMDSKEKMLFDLDELIKAAMDAELADGDEKNKAAFESGKQSIAKIKKQLKTQGLSLDSLLAMSPMPLEPYMLPMVHDGFKEGFDKNIGWCLIIPTERNMKAGIHNLIDKMLKDKKITGLVRIAVAPFLPGAESKAVKEIKKMRKLVIFQLQLEERKELTKAEKQKLIKDYEAKIGINKKKDKGKDSNKDKETKPQSKPANTSTTPLK
jgi:hypothetical protein